MINPLLNYLLQVSECQSIDELSSQTGVFLHDTVGVSDFVIILHRPHPQPFQLLLSEYYDFNFELWQDEFRSFDLPIQPITNLEFRQRNYCFLDMDYTQWPTFFLVSRRELSDDVLPLLRVWQNLIVLIEQNLQSERQRIELHYANLASQLMHDVQALMNIMRPLEKPEELKRRLEYQQKVNDIYLFYIRESELLKTSLPIRSLLRSSLEMIGIRSTELPVSIDTKLDEITVDAELFARAFNEVVKNAIIAVHDDLSKLKICVDLQESKSPLLRNDWVKITVSDQGAGIKSDFLKQVTSPFFTTHKQDGASGFGLTIAQKIITAHDGHLEINSVQGRGTEVVIYLPVSA